MSVSYHRKSDGIMRVDHKTRQISFLTFWERVRLFFGGRP
jgi:hypothetical protein